MKLVLLLNMGGARNGGEIFTFLKNMFSDEAILPIKSGFLRKSLAYLIASLRYFPAKKNYAQIGGTSPLDAHTAALVAKLNERYGSSELVFDYAYNYTPPFAYDKLQHYTNAEEIVLFPLYPHASLTTNKSSLKSAIDAVKKLEIKAKITQIEPFFAKTEFNEMILASIFNAAKGANPAEINLIFSAHSLPKKMIEKGDLYEQNVVEHFEMLRTKLKLFKSVTLAYQSRLGPVEWLGPSIAEVLAGITPEQTDSFEAGGGLFGDLYANEASSSKSPFVGEGGSFELKRFLHLAWLKADSANRTETSQNTPKLSGKKVLIYPISFCIDNSETDFELAIQYANEAKNFDFYKVVKVQNSSDEFAKFIFDIVFERQFCGNFGIKK